MKKKYLMNAVAVLALGLTAASCSKDLDISKSDIVGNAESALGVKIAPDHDWIMVASTNVNVSVNLDYGAEYTVYIFADEPLASNADYIGSATLVSGESVTVNVARPSGAGLLYAACYDKDNHAVYKSFPVRISGTSVAFGESATTTKGLRRATSTGNRWSVTPLNMPDLSAYTTGNLIEMQEEINGNGAGLPINQADGREAHLKITGSYSGSIARIQSYANQSVYVTGTWTVPKDQRCTGNSAIVVGAGGKIVVPSGHLLSTNANNNEGTTGMIYVMPGGVIEGDGQVQFSNGTQTFSYNGGNITVKNININGGTLYNAGTLGNPNNIQTALEGPGGTPEHPSLLVNLGQAYFTSTSGAGLAIYNACNIKVTGKMAIGNSSKMDDGSYIECGSLELNGSNNGGIVLNMGNAAYMNCLGGFSTNNFGVWGPAGANYTSNAIFKINDCTNVNTTEGKNGTTYMLDHIELILPEGWTTTDAVNLAYGANGQAIGWLNTNHPKYRQAQLIYQYFNGQQCYGIDSNNYQWVQVQEQGHQIDHEPWWVVDVPGYQGLVLKDNVKLYASDVDESRATCIYGTSPSYSVSVDDSENCGVNIDKGENRKPTPQVYTYAFEDTFMGDYDMNDVVLQVWEENGQLKIKLCATGASKDLYVYYDNNPLFQRAEVHQLLGAAAGKFVNTGASGAGDKFTTVASANWPVTEMSKPSGFDYATAGFNIRWGNLTRDESIWLTTRSDSPIGTAPYAVCIPDKWAWPTEWTKVSEAYPGNSTYPSFADYAGDPSKSTWYKAPDVSKTISPE